MKGDAVDRIAENNFQQVNDSERRSRCGKGYY
jgi:hypothetical protein